LAGHPLPSFPRKKVVGHLHQLREERGEEPLPLCNQSTSNIWSLATRNTWLLLEPGSFSMGTAPTIFINKEPFAVSGICQPGTFGCLWCLLTRNLCLATGICQPGTFGYPWYLSTRNLWLATGIYQPGTVGWPWVFVNQEFFCPWYLPTSNLWLPMVFFNQEPLVDHGYLSTRNLWLATGICQPGIFGWPRVFVN
jgi:hypothetical protein